MKLLLKKKDILISRRSKHFCVYVMAKFYFTPDALEEMKEISAYITGELCSGEAAIMTCE